VSEGYELVSGILDRVPQPVWVVDHAGHIVFANPAAVAALGYDDAIELLGRPSHATVHYKLPDGSPSPVDECLMLRPRLTGETVHTDADWFVRRDGSMVAVSWWSAGLAMPDGRGAVVAFTDITARLEAQRAARERDASTIRAAEARAAQRRGVEAERAVRQRIAYDLHDGAQQRLVTLMIALQLAREALEDSAEASSLLREAHQQAQHSIAELRQLSATVYPAILTNRGLAAAVVAFADRAQVPVTVSETGDRRLPEPVAAQAYFLVVEAIAEMVKRADATRIDVGIEQSDDTLTVTITNDGAATDDGHGAAGEERTASMLGLADRVNALDGTLHLGSSTGVGTVLRAVIPCAAYFPAPHPDSPRLVRLSAGPDPP
jgi:PAS domain S-box-containing protein